MLPIFEKIQAYYELARKERQAVATNHPVTPKYFIIDEDNQIVETASIFMMPQNIKFIIACTLQSEYVTWCYTPLSRVFAFFDKEGNSLPNISLNNWNLTKVEFASDAHLDSISLTNKNDKNRKIELRRNFFSSAKRAISPQEFWDMLLVIDNYNLLMDAESSSRLYLANLENKRILAELREAQYDLSVKRNTIERMEALITKMENLLNKKDES